MYSSISTVKTTTKVKLIKPNYQAILHVNKNIKKYKMNKFSQTNQ